MHPSGIISMIVFHYNENTVFNGLEFPCLLNDVTIQRTKKFDDIVSMQMPEETNYLKTK